MGQVRPFLLERPLRFVGWSWRRLRFGLVQRTVVPRTGFGFGGEGEGAAQSEPRLVRACFHAPIGLAASSKSSEKAGGWDALEEICVS